MQNNKKNNLIPAKKSLGQNWLKSKIVLQKMLTAGEVNGDDIILEVGPGKGILTEKLLAIAKKVIAVEKDNRLIELLQEKFAIAIKSGKLELVYGDILDFAIEKPQENPENLPFPSQTPPQGETLKISYKIIANIPYYITGQFLRKFLETDYQPERIVVMVQKEIADRIVARDRKESILSLSIKAYGEPKKVMKVDKENFSPVPKVDSAILLIDNINNDKFGGSVDLKDKFFTLVKAGFSSKRKVLRSNLKNLLPKEKIESLPPNIRAEDLKLDDWLKLLE